MVSRDLLRPLNLGHHSALVPASPAVPLLLRITKLLLKLRLPLSPEVPLHLPLLRRTTRNPDGLAPHVAVPSIRPGLGLTLGTTVWPLITIMGVASLFAFAVLGLVADASGP